MLDAGVPGRGHHHPRPAGQARQDRAGLVEGVVVAAAVGGQARFDAAALLLGQVPHLQQAVYEQAQSRVGGQASGADMRRAQQAKLGQILHGVADRGGRQLHAAPRQGPRPHRLAGLQIALDDAAEDVARPRIQLGKAGAAVGRVADQRIGHGRIRSDLG